MTGNKNAKPNPPVTSRINPTKGGINAPPTMAVHNTPDPSGLCSPNSSSDMLKMVGNITELQKPTSKIATMATKPLVTIDVSARRTAPPPKKAKTMAGFKRVIKAAPVNRPIIALPQ